MGSNKTRKAILSGSEAKGEASESPSGISIITLTVDNDDKAVTFIKKLFAKRLIASVNVAEGST